MTPEIKFWIAVGVAVLIKVLTSKARKLRDIAISVSASILFAWSSAELVVDYLNLDWDKYSAAVGAILALTGESVIRWVIGLNPTEAIKIWRGTKE